MFPVTFRDILFVILVKRVWFIRGYMYLLEESHNTMM